VTSHNVIFLASSDIKRHTSMELFPLNIYLQVSGYPTKYQTGYPGNKLHGYSRPSGSFCCSLHGFLVDKSRQYFCCSNL